MSFQISDIAKIIPELLLLLVAAFVLLGDLFGRWSRGDEGYEERVKEAAFMTLFGLGLAFVVTLIQGGFFLHRFGWSLNEPFSSSFFDPRNLLVNLRSSGRNSEILGGAFIVDPLTHLGRLLFIGAAFVTVLLTRNSKPSNSPGEFYALILISTIGMIFMTGAGELIMLYLGIELTSIPLYVLAGYFRRNSISAEAGVKYYIFGALSSAILLFGLSLLLGVALLNPQVIADTVPTSYAAVGSGVAIAFSTPNNPTQMLVILGMIFVIAGMAYKVAVVPFHSWSPDVYQGAPTTMTAFISTASKTAGFFLIYRVLLSVFGAPQTTGSAAILSDSANGQAFGGWASLMAIIAALTMLVGNLAALPQTNAKRMLAYSSIAHAGFLLLGLVGISRDSGVSLVYYLVVYTLTNLGAFGVLSMVEDKIGGTDFANLNGLGRRSPWLTLLLTIFILSLAGIPPLSGFFAKFYVFIAAWQQGAKWLVIFAVANTVISLYYYLRFLRSMYFAEPVDRSPITTTGGSNMIMTVTMLLVFLLGLLPNLFFGTFEQVALTLARR